MNFDLYLLNYFPWEMIARKSIAILDTLRISFQGIKFMNLIAWIVLGLLAGALAKAIYPGYQGGNILSTIVLGIVGAFVGGTLATLLQTGTLQLTATTFSLPGLFVAVIGALVAIWIWHMINRRAYY
jgi:uncharacterized membrane protein YeaQ/YmgE (transglycosylase-associated protein family)